MKITIIIVLILAVLAGAGYGVRRWMNGKAAGADATAVRVEPAIRGDLVEIVSAPGQVLPRTKVSISARVAARIIELPFEETAKVKKDDLLVKLDDKDLDASLRSVKARRAAEEAQITVARARVGAQEAQIVVSRINLADGQRDLARQKDLLATKDVSQATVDQAQAKVDGLKAQIDSALQGLKADQANLVVMQHNLEAAEAEIARAVDALSYTTIKSPIDGVVTKLNAKVGELVMTGTMNNAGTVILEVADLSQMLLVAKIDETTIAGVEVGQKANVRLSAYPDELFSGRVETVALAHTDEAGGNRYFKTEILLQTNGRRIYSGLNGDVDIETRRHHDAIKVPGQAVLGRPVDDLPLEIRNRPEVDRNKTTVTVVYRYVDGKAVVTPVSIGPSDVTHTLIRSGLSAGDLVITGPFKVLETLANDQKVKDNREATTKPAATQAVVGSR